MNATQTLTADQEEELRMLRQHFPFRIVFAAITDGKVEMFADHTKRRLNAILRKGGIVWKLS